MVWDFLPNIKKEGDRTMRQIMRSRSVVAALLGVLLWAAARVGAAESGQPTPAPQPEQCASRVDEAYIQVQKKLARQAQTDLRREAEAVALAAAAAAQMKEEEALRRYQTASRQEAERKHQVARGIADLVPEQYQLTVVDVAERFEVDPRLVAAIGTVESRWYARERGTHGYSGLMQILPDTAAWIADHMGLESYDIFDPVTNLTMGTWYLRTLYDEYGSWDQALAAYNGGPKGARLGAAHPYTRRVMSLYRQQGT
jgi:soluble lytic murein transglycosylase-like protein